MLLHGTRGMHRHRHTRPVRQSHRHGWRRHRPDVRVQSTPPPRQTGKTRSPEGPSGQSRSKPWTTRRWVSASNSDASTARASSLICTSRPPPALTARSRRGSSSSFSYSSKLAHTPSVAITHARGTARVSGIRLPCGISHQAPKWRCREEEPRQWLSMAGRLSWWCGSITTSANMALPRRRPLSIV